MKLHSLPPPPILCGMEKVDVSVILAVQRGADALPTWLAHLEQQSFPAARYEIVVADAGSADDAGVVVERFAAGSAVRMRCLHLPSVNLAQARNVAVREARGKWALFLDLDLLAGPHWIERHVQGQKEHGGDVLLAGAIQRHPQLSGEALTRWFLPEHRPSLTPDQEPKLMDCCTSNMSISRRVLMENQGFDDGLIDSHLAGIELAWRLAQYGMPRRYTNKAEAFIWQPVNFDEECARNYQFGYGLRDLENKIQDSEITLRFPVLRGFLRASLDAMVIPFYQRACQQTEENTRLMGYAYRRVLRYEQYKGYQDARKGRPPRTATWNYERNLSH
ncbi:MAG TPA: glycosyltransferase family 2 protein [Candidatus Hydrogenedentes bacterium]|nr:glycosyltransferase family 2 protein [Candidatus Hydrogenedentota bacterium]